MSTNAVQISTQTPDIYGRLHEAIKLSNLADSTKYRYGREVESARAASVNLTDAAQVARYAATLPSSRKAFLAAALRRFTKAAMRDTKAQAIPDNLNAVQATVYRLEALEQAIEREVHHTKRKPIWLSATDVRRLQTAPSGRFAQRDKVAMALLLQTGMRRHEASRALFGDIFLAGDEWKIHIIGKGAKARGVPIRSDVVDLLRDWQRVTGAGNDGEILAKSQPGGGWQPGLSADQLMQIVRKHGKAIGHADLSPHDLRRTYAENLRLDGVDLPTVSRLLGHASVATTQRYLNVTSDSGAVSTLPLS